MLKTKGIYNTIMKTTKKMTFEDTLMDKLFRPNIMQSILNPKHTNTFHDKAYNTNITLTDRVINPYQRAKDASIFDIKDDEKQEMIENEIMDHIDRIASWLKSNTKNRLTLSSTQDKTVGHGISNRNNTIKELNTQDLTVILEKDDNNSVGFKCVTAYPNISRQSENTIPTGRNLLPDLIQTRTFKKADTQQRTQLVNAVNNGVKPNADPIVRVMDKVYCDIITHPEFDPDNMKILYDFNSIMIQDESNYSYFNLTPSEQQFNGTGKALHSIAQYAYNKRNQYLSKINTQSKPTKPTATPQNNTTHIKRPKSDIPKPAKPQTNPIPQSETIPQNNQNGHVGQPKPNRSKPKMTRGEQAEKTFGANYPKPKPTNDFSLR